MPWKASVVFSEFLKVPENNIIPCFQELQITADRVRKSIQNGSGIE